MNTWCKIHDARRIMNGNFIEQHRSWSPDVVSFSEEVLRKARELEYRLVFIPEGTLKVLHHRMCMFLDHSVIDFAEGSLLEQSGTDAWCLIKVSDGKEHVPVDPHPVELLSVRDVAFASYAFMSERFSSFFQGSALVSGFGGEALVATQQPGHFRVGKVSPQEHVHLRRMVGIRAPIR